MRLELDLGDVQEKFRDLPLRYIKMEHLVEAAQVAVRCAGRATLYRDDRMVYEAIYSDTLNTLSQEKSLTSQIFMTTKREWEAIDGAVGDPNAKTTIPTGKHEMQRIPNPHGHKGYWLVLKGTLVGASEGSWRQWEEDYWNDWQVVIEEIPTTETGAVS